MNRVSPKVKANSWLVKAAEEIRRIQQRWGIPSQRKFVEILGVNGRTLAKLYADPLDESLSYNSVQQMFSNLITSVWCVCNTTEDVKKELLLLNQASVNVMRAAFPPKKELVNRALVEMEHQP